MRIEKQKICDLPMVYVTAELSLGGKRYLAAASEAPGEHAYIIDPETGDYAELWQGETGVMNIIQIPGEERLLVITKFYPIFQSKEASVCLLTPGPGGYMAPWHIEEVLKLPFVHRIGIFESDEGLFLLGCQLCHDKDFQEDWSQPGALWTAPVPKAGGEWKWSMLFSGLTKNHGLFIDRGNQVYICAENGVLLFDMKHYRAGRQMMPKLVSTTPTSDICVTQDAEGTLAGVIEPFHGDRLAVYRMSEHTYDLLADYDIAFGHVVWIGPVFGKISVIAGSRGGEDKQLEIISLQDGTRTVLDKDVGPTQITVFGDGDPVKILSANHGSGDVSLYALYKD